MRNESRETCRRQKLSYALRAACACTLLACTAGAALAQTYPTKAIRWIVTYPPGGPTDFVARAIGAKLTEAWGQQVVIDNRAGAAGVIGTELAARAVPDGYTLLFGTSAGLTINPALSDKLPYDPVRDFAPVSLLVINPQILVVTNSVPVNSVKELIAYAKLKPGQLNYASVGQGSPNHLGMELLKALARIDMLHVPYKGTGPAVLGVLGGQVALMFASVPSVIQHVRSGRLHALAVTSTTRSSAMPEVPTVAEQGLPGYELVSWFGIVAPAGAPQDVVMRLNRETRRALGSRDFAERLKEEGGQSLAMSPEEFTEFIRTETLRWAKIVRDVGAKLE